jgi:hypothetical protein
MMNPYGPEPWTYTPEIREGSSNYSTKSGKWNDVSVWSCGSIPTLSDYVIVKGDHKIVVPTEYRAYSKFISTETGAVFKTYSGYPSLLPVLKIHFSNCCGGGVISGSIFQSLAKHTKAENNSNVVVRNIISKCVGRVHSNKKE